METSKNKQYSLTLDSVLEMAIDKPVSTGSSVNEASILGKELSKPTESSLAELSLRSTPIQVPLPPKDILSKESERSATSTNNSSTVNNSSTINNAISNVVSNLIDSSIRNLATSDLIDVRNSTISNQFPSAEKVINQITKDSINNELSAIKKVTTDSFSTVKKVATDSFTAFSNLITKNLDSFKKSSSSNDNSTERSSSSNDNSTERSISSNDSITNIMNRLFDREDQSSTSNINSETSSSFRESINNQKTNLVDELSVRSKKMVDNVTVNRILKPENPVQASMERLTRVLPESINNLNSTVSSINSSASSGPVTTNEGSRINNNANTTIVQGSQPGVQSQAVETKPQKSEEESQMTAHYLQAIYAAIVSGKIKVKIEY